MKLVRVLTPLLLLLVAVPSFAICGPCDFNCLCVRTPGYGANCKPTIDCCREIAAVCYTDASSPTPAVVSEYRIASVEVVTPAARTVTTTEVRTAEAKTPPPSTVR
jgi:hypothetical protein